MVNNIHQPRLLQLGRALERDNGEEVEQEENYPTKLKHHAYALFPSGDAGLSV